MSMRIAAVLLSLASLTILAADPLASGFVTPPPSARPWVYWFPLDGNITREGITADLEAMARAGIGGVLYMETEQGTPKGPAKFASDEWRALFKHACSEAARLGLQINMNNDAGWCGSGGPWITPAMSMQRLVWSQVNVTGPAKFDGDVPQPKANKDYYGDIMLVAVPMTEFVIPHVRGKSAEVRQEIMPRAAYPNLGPESVIARSRIIDLSGKLKDNHLTWEAPEGKWTILRIGHTTTGKDNHPAPIDGRGLECDKLSKEAAEVHFNALMGKLIEENKAVTGEDRTLVSTHIDSWEVGSQNWTPRFREEFMRLRGYDPMPLLPVMTGRVIDSVEVSERFLWDVRQTVNDLLCENYAGHFRTLAHKNGIRLSIEAYDTPPCDDLTFAGRADEPMAEFWSWRKFSAAYSCTEMASAAHVYGRPILGAEAFTATNAEKWLGHPANVKDLGDWAFCEGINRFVFHRYALQPFVNPDRAPGISMGPWGLHYERTQTWWEQSKGWHAYLARCQYLLQQGLFVADLCFLAPEVSPQRFRSPVKSGLDRPGYNFDACPPEVVLTRMSVKDGRLVLPDGMNYRMLVLPQVPTMTPALLSKVRELVQAGATVLGNPPKASPSLQDYPNCDQQVSTIARELWGEGQPPDEVTVRKVGKGQIIWGKALQGRSESLYESESPLASAKWIWFKEGNPAKSAPPGTRYFRRIVKVEGGISSARVVLTADNEFECFVNGTKVGEGQDFKHAYAFDIAKLLKPGQNVIAVSANNTTDTPNPAGFVAAVSLRYADGRAEELPSDKSWEAAKTALANWKTDPAAAGWSAALELGGIGMQPWGQIAGGLAPFDPILDINVAIGALTGQGVVPDFKSSVPLRYIHKRLGESDVYFVANPTQQDVQATCTFRTTGKKPEIWWPDSGEQRPAGSFEMKDGTTTLPLRFEPSGSLFVVFREPASAAQSTAGKNWLDFARVQEISGAWNVTFDPKWGGPAAPVKFESLVDWSKHEDGGIKHYSGTAVYRKSIKIDQIPAGRTFLNLGVVEVMAQVKCNGKDLGIAWKPPYRVELTSALKPGENQLEIAVVNLWINRQIGDEFLPEDSDRNPNGTLKAWPKWIEEGKPSPTGRFTFTTHRLWKKTDALAPSGLIGPVSIESAASDK